MRVIILIVFSLIIPTAVFAHCDTLDGPLVTDAKAALEKAEVTGVLKWVKKDYEGKVRSAFEKTLAIRGASPEAKELADMYFFETVVRLHRIGEGACYTGIKPFEADLEPALIAADKAIGSGSLDALLKSLSDEMSAGLQQRFANVLEKKKRLEESVEAGREYVAVYTDFLQYIEQLSQAVRGIRPQREEIDKLGAESNIKKSTSESKPTARP